MQTQIKLHPRYQHLPAPANPEQVFIYEQAKTYGWNKLGPFTLLEAMAKASQDERECREGGEFYPYAIRDGRFDWCILDQGQINEWLLRQWKAERDAKSLPSNPFQANPK